MRELGRKKGEKGWVKGRERAKKWDDVRELRKEYVSIVEGLCRCFAYRFALGIARGKPRWSRPSWRALRYDPGARFTPAQMSDFPSSRQIVLSTCHGAGSRQLNNMNFDVCIIDEVSPFRFSFRHRG